MAKQSKAFEFGPFRLEVRERRLTRDGHGVPLRGRVFDTLHILVSRHGCLMTKDELMAAVWPDSVVEESNLNHNICVLRRALGEKATGQKYVETVPRQGYRFVADVKELDDTDVPGFPPVWHVESGKEAVREPEEPAVTSAVRLHSSAAPAGAGQPFPATRTSWYESPRNIVSLVAAVLLLIGYFGVEELRYVRSASNSRIMLAVLPFENLTGDSGQEYVADGFSHEIISQLGRLNSARLGVIAHTSSRLYHGARKSIGEIGQELRVDYVVEGSIRREADRYRITVMLIRVDDQAHLWAASYDRAAENLTALQVEVARLVISEIGRRISVEPYRDSRLAYPKLLNPAPNTAATLSALLSAGWNVLG